MTIFSSIDYHRDKHDILVDYKNRNKNNIKNRKRRKLVASDDPKDRYYKPTEDKVAFAFVAMGMAVNMPDLGYAVRTMRDIGNYKGDIYILTDMGKCLKYLNDVERVYVIEHEIAKFDKTKLLSNRFLYRTRMRQVKTQLLNKVPKHIEFITFMDTDVLTVTPNCAANFVNINFFNPDVGADWPATMAIKALWQEPGTEFHSGLFTVRRGYAEELMNSWFNHFYDNDTMDRYPFMRAVHEMYNITGPFRTYDTAVIEKRATIIGPVKKASPNDIHGVDKFIPAPWDASELSRDNNTTNYPFCFMHIPSNRCKKYGSAYVHKIVGPKVPGYRNDLCVEQNQDWLGLERTGIPVSMSMDGLWGCVDPTKKSNASSTSLGWAAYYMAQLFIVVIVFTCLKIVVQRVFCGGIGIFQTTRELCLYFCPSFKKSNNANISQVADADAEAQPMLALETKA